MQDFLSNIKKSTQATPNKTFGAGFPRQTVVQKAPLAGDDFIQHSHKDSVFGGDHGHEHEGGDRPHTHEPFKARPNYRGPFNSQDYVRDDDAWLNDPMNPHRPIPEDAADMEEMAKMFTPVSKMWPDDETVDEDHANEYDKPYEHADLEPGEVFPRGGKPVERHGELFDLPDNSSDLVYIGLPTQILDAPERVKGDKVSKPSRKVERKTTMAQVKKSVDFSIAIDDDYRQGIGNDVDRTLACPKCGERDMDSLAINEDEDMNCLSCGHTVNIGRSNPWVENPPMQVKKSGDYSNTSDDEYRQGIGDDVARTDACPNCGERDSDSLEIDDRPSGRPGTNTPVKCRTCGHSWEQGMDSAPWVENPPMQKAKEPKFKPIPGSRVGPPGGTRGIQNLGRGSGFKPSQPTKRNIATGADPNMVGKAVRNYRDERGHIKPQYANDADRTFVLRHNRYVECPGCGKPLKQSAIKHLKCNHCDADLEVNAPAKQGGKHFAHATDAARATPASRSLKSADLIKALRKAPGQMDSSGRFSFVPHEGQHGGEMHAHAGHGGHEHVHGHPEWYTHGPTSPNNRLHGSGYGDANKHLHRNAGGEEFDHAHPLGSHDDRGSRGSLNEYK